MGKSSSIGWPIWWLSGPLSEVCLSAQDFAIPMMDAAGKLGVLLSRRHPGSTASKYTCRQKPRYSRKSYRTLLKVILILTNLYWMWTESPPWHRQQRWCCPCDRRPQVRAQGVMYSEWNWKRCAGLSHSFTQAYRARWQRGLWFHLALLPFYH